ncbi:PsiF family protein [Caulobacter sp. S45]|uniref:PsiF family protein n=1 Tax=Caulobacter sp. S45 TaxID=1641861 RepID=UPI00157601F6|nr:PsiF family protein [Caulobacter sp. S45]
MRTFMLAAAAIILMAGSAMAQAPTATTTTTTKVAGHPKVTTTHTGLAPKGARTEASLACSASADSKGVHGKDREKFMRACKKSK